MKNITVLAVDDIEANRISLQYLIDEYIDNVELLLASSGEDALKITYTNDVDIIILDIQMPGIDGFEVVQEIAKQGLELPMVVFVTAFDQYALKAFDVHAHDYLLKPADETRLAQALDKIREKLLGEENALHKEQLVRLVSDVTGNDCADILNDLAQNKPVSLSHYSDVLAIKDAGEVSRVPVKDILWIDAAGDYMCVHTAENTHILRKTMKQLEESLDPKQFIRSHRATIVNKHYINKFCSQLNGEYYLVMNNGKELKVSRSYKDKVKLAVTL